MKLNVIEIEEFLKVLTPVNLRGSTQVAVGRLSPAIKNIHRQAKKVKNLGLKDALILEKDQRVRLYPKG